MLALEVKDIDRKADVLKERVVLDVQCESAIIVEEDVGRACLWIAKHTANKFLVRVSNE